MCPCSNFPPFGNLRVPSAGQCPELEEIVLDHEREHIRESEEEGAGECSEHWSGSRRLAPTGASAAEAECRHRQSDLARLASFIVTEPDGTYCEQYAWALYQSTSEFVDAACSPTAQQGGR